MKKILRLLTFVVLNAIQSPSAFAAYQSNFDAINFLPATDNTPYFTVFGTQTLDQWQGHAGFYFDYANRPLHFTGTGAFAGQDQSVIDHMIVMNNSGALGLTDWFSVGVNIPAVLYSWFYSDLPAGAPSGQPDKAAMMGDIQVNAKFRFVDIDKHHFGLALIPFFTLPTGDVARYAGSGNVTAGGTLSAEALFAERFRIALNVGAVMRDSVFDTVRNGVNMGPQATAGLGMNYTFNKHWEAIVETFTSTVLKDLFNTVTTPLEVGGGIRYNIGNSGFSTNLGGTAGLIDGVGSPRFRGFFGLTYASHPVVCSSPPDARIQGNRIVLFGKIFYDTNKTTIKPISFPVLDDVVDVMNKHPEITLVEVQGHTDARASDAYNMKLSQGRAESAVKYLIDKGINVGRMRAMGYGESRPIASNDTVEGMSQNRRTEFIIISSSNGMYTEATPTVPTPVAAPTSVPATTTSTPIPTPSKTTMPTPTGGTTEYPNYSYPPPTN